jgi:PRTRC genetic system protein B
LVLHTNQPTSYGGNQEAQAVTYHPIKDDAIQQGFAIDKARLQDAIGQSEVHKAMDFIEPTTLMNNASAAIWYRPSMKRQMHFASKVTGKCQFNVRFPATLFILSKPNKSLYLFGLPDDKRPTLQTRLYRLPIGNVSERGHLCQGSGSSHMPTDIHQGTFQNAERVFFDAVSGHTSTHYLFAKDEKAQRKTHFDSVIRYWQKHAEKGTKPSVKRDFIALSTLEQTAKGVL